MKKTVPIVILLLLFRAVPLHGVTLRVCPVNCSHESIQEAIDAAADGDRILVAPGEYLESINFNGKAITVLSEEGPARTVIKGGASPEKGTGSVVTFESGEGEKSVLDGFSITHGSGGYIKGLKRINFLGGSTRDMGTYGGGILCTGSSPVINNCVIKGNFADKGGGIACWIASPRISNCIISGNRSSSSGGGFYLGNSEPRIIHSTISGNLAGESGGGLFCYWSGPVVFNSIVWENRAALRADNFEGCGTIIAGSIGGGHRGAITYSLVEANKPLLSPRGERWYGEGNIGSNPRFVDARNPEEAPTTEGDYHLAPGSPAIDRGRNHETAGRDIDGDDRPLGAGIDMGADEFNFTVSCRDADGDGFSPNEGCGEERDCDDTWPDSRPGMKEVCDGRDNDCNGQVDEGCHRIVISTDRDSYRSGEVMKVILEVAPERGPAELDLYIRLNLPFPEGHLYVPSWESEPSPLVSLWKIERVFPEVILEYEFTGRETPGSYLWEAGLLEPGTGNPIGERAVAPFTFTP